MELELGQTKVGGPHKGPRRALGGRRPPALWAGGGPPPVDVCTSIFYIFNKKISTKFPPISRTFISAQKTTPR